MKIGIITFYKKNYGAFLQAYALQRVLKDLGHEPEAIKYDFLADTSLSDAFSNPVYFLKKTISDLRSRSDTNKKIKIFAESISKHLNESSYEYKNKADLAKNTRCYDMLITGSDQVWNPMIFPKNLDIRLLEFAPEGKKRVSYAASISSKKVTAENKAKIVKALGSFDSISVREESTRATIGEVPGKTVHRHIDPCLLLDGDRWNEIAEDIKEENYILVYRLMSQLGMMDYVESVARERGLKIISIGKLPEYKGEYTCIPYTSPEKFLGYMRKASLIVTNTFHGVVFSLVYRKRATFFLPAASHDRALDLITKTGTKLLLEQRYLSDEELSGAYKDIDAFLTEERSRSTDYLKEVCKD